MTRPIIALLYDFDKTLCTTDMEDYAFIPGLGYDPGGVLAGGQRLRPGVTGWTALLAYMYTMMQECPAAGSAPSPGRTFWCSCGREHCALSRRARTGSGRINAFGLQLRGCRSSTMSSPPACGRSSRAAGISHEFREIYACEFYLRRGLAGLRGPSWTVNFTNKTQFVYRINKGVLDVSDDKDAQRLHARRQQARPLHQHDLHGRRPVATCPCMKMMRAYGGQAIAVYQEANRPGVEDSAEQGTGGLHLPRRLQRGDRRWTAL